MHWSDLPREARRYILYHALASPLLFTWYMAPYYLLRTGYTALDVGIIFSLARVAAIPSKMIVGRFFTYRDIRLGLASIDAIGVLSLLLYSMARGPLAPILIFAALLLEEIVGLLYPLYPAYERAIYPRDKLKEAMEWHMRIPELSIVLAYPLLGYLFGVACPRVECVLRGFLLFALYECFLSST